MKVGDRFEDCDYNTDSDTLSEMHLYEVDKVWVIDGIKHFTAKDLGPVEMLPDGWEEA